MKKQFFFTLVCTFLVFFVAEIMVRIYMADFSKKLSYQDLIEESISGREKSNRFIKHNLFIMSRFEDKENINAVFSGTSRTKVLKPHSMSFTHAMNIGGNSYNEITYGLLIELEAARKFFPNLKKVYLEASLLMRKPLRNSVLVEKDHEKYLGHLLPLLTYRKPFGNFEAATKPSMFDLSSSVFKNRNKLKLSAFLTKEPLVDMQTSAIIKGLNSYGELRRKLPNINTDPVAQISEEHIKVRRINDIGNYKALDYFFDTVAEWANDHGIQILLFQPPVRGDLFAFQKKFGLARHAHSLKETANAHKLTVIDFNHEGNGVKDKWALFSDEDHVGTCLGGAYILSGIKYYEKHGPGYYKVHLPDFQDKYLKLQQRNCSVSEQ